MKKLFLLPLVLMLWGESNVLIGQDRAVIDSLRARLPENPGPRNTQDLYNLAIEFSKYGAALDSIQVTLDQILEIAERYDHTASYVRANFLQAIVAYRNQDVKKSKYFFEQAHAILDTSYYTDWQVSIPNALGVVNAALELNDLAVKYYLEAIAVAEANKKAIGLPQACGNLAILFGNMNETEKAMIYFQKAISLNTKSKNKVGAITNMYSLSEMFLNEDLPDSAQLYAERVLQESKAIKYKLGIIRGHKSLGNIFAKTHKTAQAKFHADWVLEHAEMGAEKRVDRLSAFRILALSNAQSGRRSAAYEAIDSALFILNAIQMPLYNASTYENLCDAYEALGDYQKALVLHRKFYTIQDSLRGAETRKRALSMLELYETEKKEREILGLSLKTEKQASKLKRRNQLLWFLGGITLLTILAMYLIFRQRAFKAREKALEAEQRLLRIQMNPHFLFNALSSIQNYLFDKDDIKKALHYMARFSQLMRQVLEYGRETFISLEDEIDTLENYLSLQQLRYDQAFDYEIEIDPSLNSWEIRVPPLMAQPFVENAIEHGKVHEVENGKIWIRFLKDKDQIRLVVEDNGQGRAKSKVINVDKKHKSLATSITKDRLAVLGDLTKRKFAFNIIDLPNRGTKVEFELPATE
ncbi:MAG: histidine kinase [Bacteroidia bacterium]